MLGQPIFLQIPQIIGYKITGQLQNDMITSIDIVLAITKHLRQLNMNKCFVEFFGDGVAQLSVSERETLSHMCSDYGATVAYFPMDEHVMTYLRQTGRSKFNVDCMRAYLTRAKLMNTENEIKNERVYSEVHEFDLSTVKSYCSGPKKLSDKIEFNQIAKQFELQINESCECAVSFFLIGILRFF